LRLIEFSRKIFWKDIINKLPFYHAVVLFLQEIRFLGKIGFFGSFKEIRFFLKIGFLSSFLGSFKEIRFFGEIGFLGSFLGSFKEIRFFIHLSVYPRHPLYLFLIANVLSVKRVPNTPGVGSENLLASLIGPLAKLSPWTVSEPAIVDRIFFIKRVVALSSINHRLANAVLASALRAMPADPSRTNFRCHNYK
jgi:hypothetical protein